MRARRRARARAVTSARGHELAVAGQLVADLEVALAEVVAEVRDLRHGYAQGVRDGRLPLLSSESQFKLLTFFLIWKLLTYCAHTGPRQEDVEVTSPLDPVGRSYEHFPDGFELRLLRMRGEFIKLRARRSDSGNSAPRGLIPARSQ